MGPMKGQRPYICSESFLEQIEVFLNIEQIWNKPNSEHSPNPEIGKMRNDLMYLHFWDQERNFQDLRHVPTFSISPRGLGL